MGVVCAHGLPRSPAVAVGGALTPGGLHVRGTVTRRYHSGLDCPPCLDSFFDTGSEKQGEN